MLIRPGSAVCDSNSWLYGPRVIDDPELDEQAYGLVRIDTDHHLRWPLLGLDEITEGTPAFGVFCSILF